MTMTRSAQLGLMAGLGIMLLLAKPGCSGFSWDCCWWPSGGPGLFR